MMSFSLYFERCSVPSSHVESSWNGAAEGENDDCIAKLSKQAVELGKSRCSWLSKPKESKAETSKGGANSARSRRSDRGDDPLEAMEELEEVESPGSSKGARDNS